MAEIPKDLLQRARGAVDAEEREKAFLKDRSKDGPSLTPPDSFIEQSLGKSRDPKQTAEAVLDRARAYQRNASPAPDYVEFPERAESRDVQAKSLAAQIKDRVKGALPSRDRGRDR
jgi:hypothetical protein